jgi:ATP diphosphatase
MNRLRDPQYGCPWDIKQTYATIVPHTLEEAYEVADAIERGDFDHLQGELGDLLFQVVLQPAGPGRRALRIRRCGRQHYPQADSRHPHVFPTGDLYAPWMSAPERRAGQTALGAIKAEERAEKSDARTAVLLDDVPAHCRHCPLRQIAEARSQVGFDWPDGLAGAGQSPRRAR